MEDQHKIEIIGAIGELKGKVDVGFQGVHKRQDITNGRLEKTEDRVGQLEQENKSQETDLKWLKKNYWIVVSASIGTFFTVLTGILLFLLKSS